MGPAGIAVAGFFGIAGARLSGLDHKAPAMGAVLVAVLVTAVAGGVFFKGKSGWCSSICPLLPLQRVYGQTPFVTVPNSHCTSCVGCAKNCYDFKPRAAWRAGGKGPVVLTVVGRKSGKPRSTPVTPMIVDDKRYIVAGVPGSDWASNARAAGEATVHQGRRAERVRMVEMSVEEARPLLREFPVRVATVRSTRRPTASATRSQYLHHEKPQNHRSTPQPVNTTGGTSE